MHDFAFSVQPVPECYENNDCRRNEDVCNLGSCINACRVAECGVNARCETGFHSHQCVCPEGFIGDPAVECYPCRFKYLVILFIIKSSYCST